MDPMRNNNSPVIKRIAKRSLAANRTRNIFAICAIILTTFMLSSVFSIGSSLLQNMKIMQIRAMGTTASVFLKNPSDSQIEQVKKQDLVQAAGMEIAVGSVKAKTASEKDAQIAMAYYDDTQWREHYQPAISHIHGEYPRTYDEIMLSERALKQLDIQAPKKNQTIRLTYVTRLGTKTSDFRLSGWYRDYTPADTGMALLSKDYCLSEGFTGQKDGRLSISCAPGDRLDCQEQLNRNVSLQKGQTFQSSYDPREGNSTDTLYIAATLIGIALFIVLSGYLLIYNVLYISVTKDIRFYGMLKTIGAAPRQIKKLVRSQIFRLSAVGIPIGILLAAAASFIVVPFALTLFSDSGSSSEIMPGDVSFNPWIFIATMLFSLLTVIVSCRKPAKIAGNVSPVEALKYTGLSSGRKSAKRHSTSGGNVRRMAFHNVFRGKKRSALVFASLFMGTITFLGVTSFIDSLGVDQYLERYMPNDFRITSIPPINHKFDEQYIASLSKIDGVDSMEAISTLNCDIDPDEKTLEPLFRSEAIKSDDGTSYEDLAENLKLALAEGQMGVWIFSIDDHYVEDYNKSHESKIDLTAFRQGKLAILGYDDGSGYGDMLGRSIKLSPKGQGKYRTVKVGGIFDHEDCLIPSGYGQMAGLMDLVFVSDAFMKKMSPDPVIYNITINVDSGREPYVEQQIQKLNSTLVDTSFEFHSKSDIRESFLSGMTSMRILGGGISIMLLIIGVLNFINVMLTSVYTRRQELAVMESVGMTKRQIKNMLTWEGGYYALITTGLILTVGNGLLWLMSRSVTGIADYAVYHYPILLLILLIQLLFIICLLVPRIVFRATSKESVTERLHQIDS